MIEFRNENLSLKIDPENGCSKAGLSFKNQEILSFKKQYSGFLMLPFVNRIEDGRYSLRDKTYQLEINEISGKKQYSRIGEKSKV